MKLQDVKLLHDKGFSLIYLHPKDKRPIGKDWTTKPSKTWEELKRTFKPENNLGVRLGAHSKIGKNYLACIDVDVVDPNYRKAAIKKMREITKGETFPEVRSGSGNGSRHLYCVTSEPFKMITVAKEFSKTEVDEKGKPLKLWEICIYSTGRQMVLPPSIHPSGAAYTWMSEATDFPTLDISEFEVLQENKLKERELDFKAQDVNLYETNLPIKHIKIIEEGQGSSDRSADLFAVTLSMCRVGFTDNQILSVLSNPENWISSAAYEHTQSTSRARAVKWLHKYTLTKARYETDIFRKFEHRPVSKAKLSSKETEREEKEAVVEENRTFPDTTKAGDPKPTILNTVHALEKVFGDEKGGLVGRDEFANRIYFLKDTPYGGVTGREMVDQDDLNLVYHLAKHFNYEPSQDNCFKAHSIVADKYRYHPVRDYLDGLEWDEVPRLDQWLKSAFNAKGPRAYLEAVGRKVLTAAVARVYEPGCKFDYMMVLEGHQGKGKSKALRNLTTAAWFTDGIGDIQNKDVVDNMQGKWIIEMGELANLKRTDVESTKAFISRAADRIRMAYGRRAADYPRQSIFIGSTNGQEYLIDETGNRRFWPINITSIDQSWIIKNKDQLWAEAKLRYELGEELYLTPEIEKLAEREQEKRFTVDEWQSEIQRILEDVEDGTPTTTELWRGIMGPQYLGAHPQDADCKRISKIMRRMSYTAAIKRVGGILTRLWVKI